jgi:hypothetical protein
MTAIFRTVRALANDAYNPAHVDGVSVATGAVADVDQNSARIAPQIVAVCLSGTTAQRPKPGDSDVANGPRCGDLYLDTSLGSFITWTGASWRDPLTGDVV